MTNIYDNRDLFDPIFAGPPIKNGFRLEDTSEFNLMNNQQDIVYPQLDNPTLDVPQENDDMYVKEEIINEIIPNEYNYSNCTNDFPPQYSENIPLERNMGSKTNLKEEFTEGSSNFVVGVIILIVIVMLIYFIYRSIYRIHSG